MPANSHGMTQDSSHQFENLIRITPKFIHNQMYHIDLYMSHPRSNTYLQEIRA